MEVILLERVARLGQMGDVVRVKDGFARNFLLPQGKALRANKQNKARFESERAQLEADNLERKNEADAVAQKLQGESFVAIRQAGESGQLYGSVSTRDISELLTEGGFTVNRNQVNLNVPIKALGLHEVEISLHPEVEVMVTINVARSEDEAERQARGEDVTLTPEEEDMEDIMAAAEEVFEDEELAQEAVQELTEEPLEETDEAGEGSGEAASEDAEENKS